MSERADKNDWRRQRLCWAIQALAMPSHVQLRLFPDFVCKGDELALEFDEHYRATSRDGFTDNQRETLEVLDQKLADMSRGGRDYSEALWLDDTTLSTSPHWAEVRTLATAVLAAFDWPVEKPPEDAADRGSIYVQG